MMTLGMRLERTSLLSVEPKSSMSSSKTILTTFCAGERDSMTSAVMQRSLVRATKSLTTLKLTSASRSAMRMSRIALVISASVSLPLPRKRSKVSVRRSDRLLNMGPPPLEQSFHWQVIIRQNGATPRPPGRGRTRAHRTPGGRPRSRPRRYGRWEASSARRPRARCRPWQYRRAWS